MYAFDRDPPETWPLHLFDKGRLGALPDPLLRRVADQLTAVREVTAAVAFARLMVTAEMERRDDARRELDLGSAA